MAYLKFLLTVINGLIDLILLHMRKIEKTSDLDADGLPTDPYYEELGYFLAKIRDYRNDFECLIDDFEKCQELDSKLSKLKEYEEE